MPMTTPSRHIEGPRYPQPVLVNDDSSYISRGPAIPLKSVSSSAQAVPPSLVFTQPLPGNDLPYPFMYYPPRYLARNDNGGSGRTNGFRHESSHRCVRYEPYSRAWRRVREMDVIPEEPELHAMKEVETDVPAARAEIEARGDDVGEVVPPNPVDHLHHVGFLQRLMDLAFAAIEMIFAPWRHQN
ncbi:hypothetical protein FISHEDRAFT_75435 [Fistulina hepatica ATCC 64428]|uniref:Uncharacterized protein n=1 Tax=Fistulina hepatica ATCC 64428 TaxID=1128425 RepID=A0A0D7A7A2_9AGAR|nr:hypothetical protein FISHEDRAFT_75435 [Fistulina hepatica ATCC 64428]